MLNSPENTIADSYFLIEKLGFSEGLPKIWLNKIQTNETNQFTSSKYINIFKIYLIFDAEKISKEFGAIGLLIYSQIRNLEYFDIEKEMILINQIDESDSSSLYSKMKSIS